MNKDIGTIILSEKQISEIIDRIAGEIENDYKDNPPLFIGLLKGSFIFLADLVRKIKMPAEVDFLAASSYGNRTVTSGSVKLGERSYENFIGKDVIIVEDILDSGKTLSAVRERLYSEGVKSIKICTLLDKPYRRMADIKADYLGIEIPDLFVVGYGMDYAEKYRNLPYVGELKAEIYS